MKNGRCAPRNARVVVGAVLAAAFFAIGACSAGGPGNAPIPSTVAGVSPSDTGAGGAIERARPGKPLRVDIHRLADEGDFDPGGPFVIESLPTTRGYEAIYIGLTSKDPKKGARLAVYSPPLGTVVRLTDDLNLQLRDRPIDAGSSQRSVCPPILAPKQRKVYFGTANRPEPDGYDGGHVMEFDTGTKEFRDLGVVLKDWSILKMVAEDSGRFLVVLGCTRSKDQTALYRFDPNSGGVEDTGVRDVADICPGAGRNTWYLAGRETPLRRWQAGKAPEVVSVAPAEGTKEKIEGAPVWLASGLEVGHGLVPGSNVLIRMDRAQNKDTFKLMSIGGEPGESLAKAPPQCVRMVKDRWWNTGAFAGSLIGAGALYLTRPSSAGAGVDLAVHLLKDGTFRRYGPILERGSERRLTQALAMGIDRQGNAYVLGTMDDRRLCLAVVEDVLVDELIDAQFQSVKERVGEAAKSALRAKSFSLTAVGTHMDRPFDALSVASDGKVYFGTMPHHPSRGTLIFRYDPQADKVETLGDIDVLAGEKGPDDMPSMMHSAPVEVGGYVFFTGQDPFYGREHKAFPEVVRDARYPGTHVLGYEMKTGRFRDFGMPSPGRSIFWTAADPKRKCLYLRQDYEAGRLFRLDVASGKMDDLEIDCPTKKFLVGPDGRVYFSDGSSLIAYDPDKRSESVIARDVGEHWHWIKGQDGKAEACAMVKNDVYHLDTAAGKVKKVATLEARGYLAGDHAYRDGVVYASPYKLHSGVRVCHLLTLKLSDGKTKDHGVIVDQKGRIVQTAHALDVGADGTVYAAGQVWSQAGDPYSPRLRPPYESFNDDCLLVIQGVAP